MEKLLSNTELWITYQCGAHEVSLAELCLCERSWESRFNSAWHGNERASIANEVEALLQRGLLMAPKEESNAIPLSSTGQKLWETSVKPKWDLAYQWTCDSASRDCMDYSISISATNVARLLTLICMDIADGFYGLIDPGSMRYSTNVSFSPLSWRTIDFGVRVDFEAAILEKTVANLEKSKSVGEISRRWFPSYECVTDSLFPRGNQQ